MNINRDKHNIYKANTVYSGVSTGAIGDNGTSNKTTVVYLGGGGSGLTEDLLKSLKNQNAFSFLDITGSYTSKEKGSEFITKSILSKANKETDTASLEFNGSKGIKVDLFDAVGVNEKDCISKGSVKSVYNISYLRYERYIKADPEPPVDQSTLKAVTEPVLPEKPSKPVQYKTEVYYELLLSFVAGDYVTDSGSLTLSLYKKNKDGVLELLTQVYPLTFGYDYKLHITSISYEFKRVPATETEPEQKPVEFDLIVIHDTSSNLDVLIFGVSTTKKPRISISSDETTGLWKFDEKNKAVYTDYNVYSLKEISAYGHKPGEGEGGGSVSYLKELKDVNYGKAVNPTNKNTALIWDGATWSYKSTDSLTDFNKMFIWDPDAPADKPRIKALFDFYGVGEVSAYGYQDGTPGEKTLFLNDLDDVNVIQVKPNQVLSWNGTNWTNTDIKNGTDLTEVDAKYGFLLDMFEWDSPQTKKRIKAKSSLWSVGEISAYGYQDGKPGGSVAYLKELKDVNNGNNTNPLEKDTILIWNGTTWAYKKSDSLKLNFDNFKAGYGILLKNDTTNLTISVNKDKIIELVSNEISKMFVWDTTDPNKKKIKALYDFYGVGEVSAYGDLDGLASSGASYLHELKDVQLHNLTQNQILSWDGTNWVNINQKPNLDESALQSYLSTNIKANNGVSLSTLGKVMTFSANMLYIMGSIDKKYGYLLDMFEWDTTLSKERIKAKKSLWSVGELAAYGYREGQEPIGALFLNELKDVSITNLLNDQILVYDGQKWVNTNLKPSLDTTALNEYLINNGYITNTVLSNTTITAGKGLIGGGNLTTNRTFDVVSANDGIIVGNNDIKLNTVNDYITDSIVQPLSASRGKDLNDRLNTFENHFTFDHINKIVYTDYNFYSEKEVSAYGLGKGGTSTGALYLYELKDISENAVPTQSDMFLYFNGTSWVYKPKSELEFGLNEQQLSDYLTANKYVQSSDLSKYDTHITNSTIHVTLDDKNKWNGYGDKFGDYLPLKGGKMIGAIQYGNSSSISQSLTEEVLKVTSETVKIVGDLSTDIYGEGIRLIGSSNGVEIEGEYTLLKFHADAGGEHTIIVGDNGLRSNSKDNLGTSATPWGTLYSNSVNCKNIDGVVDEDFVISTYDSVGDYAGLLKYNSMNSEEYIGSGDGIDSIHMETYTQFHYPIITIFDANGGDWSIDISNSKMYLGQSQNSSISIDIDGNLHVPGNIIADGEVSAFGEGTSGGVGSVTIVDNLTSYSTDAALSANLGRVLKELIDNKTIDLNGYYTSKEVDTKLATKANKSAISDMLTKTVAANTYLPKGNYLPAGNYLTSIPSEYVTDTELANKGYATNTKVDNLADKCVGRIAYTYGSGCLVATNIPADSNNMVTFKIEGNSYLQGDPAIFTIGQFYDYSDTPSIFLAYSATHYGYNFGDIIAFDYKGYVYLWFVQQSNFQTFNVYVFTNGTAYNQVTSISNVAMPTSGVTKKTVITPKGIVTELNNKLDKSIWDRAFYFEGNDLKARVNIIGEKEISAYGAGESGSSAGVVNIADNLTTNDPTYCLSARQGVVLKELINSNVTDLNNNYYNKTIIDGLLNGKANKSHTHTWGLIGSTPTTIAGYGITDSMIYHDSDVDTVNGQAFQGGYLGGVGSYLSVIGKGFGGQIRFHTGSSVNNMSYRCVSPSSVNGWTNIASEDWVNNQGFLKSVAFGDLTSHPTTLAGYGITDAVQYIHAPNINTSAYLGASFHAFYNESGVDSGSVIGDNGLINIPTFAKCIASHYYQTQLLFPNQGDYIKVRKVRENSVEAWLSLTTDKNIQTISGAKTFKDGTWILESTENNAISNVLNQLKWIPNAESSIDRITNSIDFRWYNTHWRIGNIRGGSTNSIGFGIGYVSTDHMIPSLRVDQTESYINNHKVWHVGNLTPIGRPGSNTNSEIFNDYINNKAAGNSSHAEGSGTSAGSKAAHAEGLNTVAGTLKATKAPHAEGNYTTASNDFAHAEGTHSAASGIASHAEGDDTTASGGCSHAEGCRTIASASSSHAEGNGTTASKLYAHAEGHNTVASGEASHAEGNKTTASNSFAHAEGGFSSATGIRSHAEGAATIATGDNSHAEGDATQAIGNGAHSEGGKNFAIGVKSHAEGMGLDGAFNSKTLHVIKIGQETESPYSFNVRGDVIHEDPDTMPTPPVIKIGDVISVNNVYYGVVNAYLDNQDTETKIIVNNKPIFTIGDYTAIIGTGGFAYGSISHIEGSMCNAVGSSSHAEGTHTKAIGGSSHSEGIDTRAFADASHAEGCGAEAHKKYAHAEGYWTDAYGDASHAEGKGTQAHGGGSHAEGANVFVAHLSGTANVTRYQVIGDHEYIDKGAIVYDKRLNELARVINVTIGLSGNPDIISLDKTLDAVSNVTQKMTYYISSHVNNTSTHAIGAHSEGLSCEAIGVGSHAGGISTTVLHDGGFTCGSYNSLMSNGLFIVGNGSPHSRSNAFSIDAYGNALATGEVTAYSSSDINLKTNINKLDNALSIIDNIKPITFNWNDTAKQLNNNKDDRLNYGVIAQELEEVLPELVHPIYSKYKSVDYVSLVPILILAVKELKNKIDQYELRNNN